MNYAHPAPETVRTRLAFVEMCISEYPFAVRFEIERAMFVPGFAPGPTRTPEYRKLFEEREALRAAVGLKPADLTWPLQRREDGPVAQEATRIVFG